MIERFFMPALQMGYINHNSNNISAGLIIQTSLDYRTKKNLIIRLNYDDFSGRLNATKSINETYNGRIPISELIGGFGYRLNKKKHNFFAIIQTGIRFYENPTIQNNSGIINIKQEASTIGSLRYTTGYEYEIFENVFLNTELFIGHFLKEKDYWRNTKPYFGITAGISARLF
jgi:hypothetical protein